MTDTTTHQPSNSLVDLTAASGSKGTRSRTTRKVGSDKVVKRPPTLVSALLKETLTLQRLVGRLCHRSATILRPKVHQNDFDRLALFSSMESTIGREEKEGVTFKTLILKMSELMDAEERRDVPFGEETERTPLSERSFHEIYSEYFSSVLTALAYEANCHAAFLPEGWLENNQPSADLVSQASTDQPEVIVQMTSLLRNLIAARDFLQKFFEAYVDPSEAEVPADLMDLLKG